MSSLLRFASFGRPRGLAARAVLLTTGLMALTAALCVGIVLAIENDSKTGTRRFH
ncbi:MAG TPA: hypothetical protein PLS69_11815 [Terricaulis sp.]|nr:hypothetical protein [Terricaulis sp.]